MDAMLKKVLYFFLFFGILFPLHAEEEVESDLLSLIEEEEFIAAAENLGPSAAGFLDDEDFGPNDPGFIDPHVLRDFIESKGLIECRKKSGLLTIAGDVRARWVTVGERVDGVKKRGSGTDIAADRFKSEVNLFFDYVAPRSWVSTKLKWVNFDGTDGGTPTRVSMDRAFIGYDIYKQGELDFYIEVGRSRLNYIYESRVEFTSLFDGIHLYFTNCWPTVGTFSIHGGPFIVDSFTNHYAWIMETGIIGFMGTGFGVKYSIVNWNRSAPTLDYGNLKDSGKTKIRNNPRYSFLVSQLLGGYERKIDIFHCKTLYIYAAVLANHDAKRSVTSNGRYLNHAWYAGFTLGKLCKACDWSLDINYQSVQMQAVPEFDLAGLGHGNADDGLFSDAILIGLPPGAARGFTNYKGWDLSLLYALTDSLSLRTQAQYATPRNKSVGGDFRYKAFEMSAIYAF